jgi:hypothetical protein
MAWRSAGKAGWLWHPALFVNERRGEIRLILTTSSNRIPSSLTRQIHKIGIAIPMFATIRYGLRIPQAIMLVAMVKNMIVMVTNKIQARILILLNHPNLQNLKMTIFFIQTRMMMRPCQFQ